MNKKYTLGFLLFLSMSVIFTACKKEGCTDITATNYDAEAEDDDGSCTYADPCDNSSFADSFSANGNTGDQDPGITADNLVPSNSLDQGNAPTDSWFDNVTYRGAFGTSDWTDGWTLYSGYNPASVPTNEVQVSGTVAAAGETVNWTNDNVYILNGFCFVEGTLDIQEGTIIKGAEGTGEDAAALIIARGAQIFAEGTASEPIIFTYEADDFSSATASTRGQWGGLIVLGSASLNSSPGVTQIEGIPTNEPRGEYGGNDDTDNSGVITYVSIRHGGSDIGAGNEINGLTLGGVGNGTTINHVEVISNSDDGVEFFGGTADTKHMLVAYCGDDNFDYDEGFRGRGQFWAVVQADDDGDRGGEHDGGTEPETATPYATPVIFNATYFGNGEGRALTFRDNAGGEYHNSVFVNWDKGVDVELLSTSQDSFKQFEDGNLALAGNAFWNISAGDSGSDLFTVSCE